MNSEGIAKTAHFTLTHPQVFFSKKWSQLIIDRCDIYDVFQTDTGLRFNYYLLQPFKVCNRWNNQNYCENNIIGPIYRDGTAQQSQNDAFFFSNFCKYTYYFLRLNLERFSLRTYEYHETNQSIRDGYIFALFSMKNATRDVLINELDNPESLMDLKESCLDELKNLKIKKNIG